MYFYLCGLLGGLIIVAACIDLGVGLLGGLITILAAVVGWFYLVVVDVVGHCLLRLIVWFGFVVCWFGFSCVLVVFMFACGLMVDA